MFVSAFFAKLCSIPLNSQLGMPQCDRPFAIGSAMQPLIVRNQVGIWKPHGAIAGEVDYN
jgi:hypothetical protein